MAEVAPAGGLGVRSVLEPLLLSYSQVLFSDRPAVGAVLLAATWVRPTAAAFGLLAVLLSFAVVGAARFSLEQARRGLYGYNPLLLGLAVGAFYQPGPQALGLLVVAVVLTVFLQTALESALGAVFTLPVLSFPFVLVLYGVLAVAPQLGVTPAQPPGAVAPPAWLPGPLSTWLEGLGSLLFAGWAWAGALVLLALLVATRIGVLLALVGGAVALGVVALAAPLAETDTTVLVLNAAFTALALGGFFFVPQRSALVLAAVGALLASLLSLAALALLPRWGLIPSILPFNLTTALVLYAMRQRVLDGRPKAVDFTPGAPEANLSYYRTRVERFGAGTVVRFALPFSGKWTVSQGVDGPHTHRGPWRHALDFEVHDAAGQKHRGAGTALADHLCYRLPVLAAADGTVVKVVRDVADNPLGQRNPRDPWGNLVVLVHGPALYSLVCHLAPGSVEVVEGQVVRQGQRLGRCGNSGRSFTPHLHFQLQASPRPGAPTRELSLDAIVQETGAGPSLRRAAVPQEGEAWRNLERSDEVAACFAFPLGSRWRFAVDGASQDEVVISHLGLFNDLTLDREGRPGRLWYENQGSSWIAWDYAGPPDSVLSLLSLCAPRVPYEVTTGLGWDDVVSAQRLRPRWVTWLLDVVEPFLAGGGQPFTYQARREGELLVVEGTGRAGRDAVRTLARFDAQGPLELRVERSGVARSARRLEVRDAA